jgi:hypothetical protein
VRDEFHKYQCVYLERFSNEADASRWMKSSILGDFTRAKDLNKPVIGNFFLVGDNENYARHAVVVTGFTSAVAFNPPRTVYSINYIDPNGPVSGTLTCRSVYIGGQDIITCDIPSRYRTINNSIVVRRIYLSSDGAIIPINNILLNMSTVRTNSVSWLNSNYTLLDNYGSQGRVAGGVCTGWSEFNVRAAQLVKECVAPPLSLPKTSVNTKEEISFLNQLTVQETITDKYLAQLALLWQIDDMLAGLWERVVN